MAAVGAVPSDVRRYLSEQGRKGGSVKSPRKARSSEVARAAVTKRWDRYRAEKARKLGEKGPRENAGKLETRERDET